MTPSLENCLGLSIINTATHSSNTIDTDDQRSNQSGVGSPKGDANKNGN